VLMAAVKAGVGREVAHEAIKEHAVAVALELREKGTDGNDLFDRLAADERLRLTRATIDEIVADPLSFTGAAGPQIAAFVSRVDELVRANPDAARYRGEAIL